MLSVEAVGRGKVALKELQTAVTKRDSTVAQEWMAFNLKAQKDEI